MKTFVKTFNLSAALAIFCATVDCRLIIPGISDLISTYQVLQNNAKLTVNPFIATQRKLSTREKSDQSNVSMKKSVSMNYAQKKEALKKLLQKSSKGNESSLSEANQNTNIKPLAISLLQALKQKVPAVKNMSPKHKAEIYSGVWDQQQSDHPPKKRIKIKSHLRR